MTTTQHGFVIQLFVLVAALPGSAAQGESPAVRVFRAGAAAVDITPTEFPAIVSGSFLERMADRVRDPLHARALVLDDGTTRLAIVVVDTLMMPRELLDDAKELARQRTEIPPDRMLIAATHTHSAPSVMGALGTGVDDRYAKRLPPWIAQAVEHAVRNLAPARVGWTVVDDFEHTNCRRWIRRPDVIGTDPFGGQTVRAMMHPGYQNPEYVGPAGPEDPALSILAVQSPEGHPLALLANYSMHYYGAEPVSADYYGRFCQNVTRSIAAEHRDPPFVAIMSQGTSGDLHWMDYSRPAQPPGLDEYAQQVARIACDAYRKIVYHDWVPLVMAETTLTLARRTPDEARLAWADRIIADMQGRKPKDLPEVYALEQVHLKRDPVRELKLQAVRIGELGMVAIPCEVYGITGLKIKAASPLQPTINFELANGAEGYIPPPEQHFLGGYTTWPARTAGLERQAEPKIVETVLSLLERVASRPRLNPADPLEPYGRAVLKSKPIAYLRLGELTGPQAADASGHNNHGACEEGVAFGLPGPTLAHDDNPGRLNRAAHFAGGRVRVPLGKLAPPYSIEMWFWNGLPAEIRDVTGCLFSRGADQAGAPPGDQLGITGRHAQAGGQGKLFFHNGDPATDALIGTTEITLRTWNHLALVRDGIRVSVYLNGGVVPEIAGETAAGPQREVEQLFIGGRNNGLFGFEGKIDEVAVYDRTLDPREISDHYAAATSVGAPRPSGPGGTISPGASMR